MVHAIRSLSTIELKLPAQVHSILPSDFTQSWAPHLALAIIGTLATSIHPTQSVYAAALSTLDLFDRLRLREPLAKSFQSLGIEGVEAWRAAARIKVLLLVEAQAQQEPEEVASESISEPILQPILPLDLWQDPDVRWLTGIHTSEGHEYIVREPYEQLLWFLSLPLLLHLPSEPLYDEVILAALEEEIEESLTALESAGYRLDKLLTEEEPTTPEPAVEPEPESTSAPEPAAEQGSAEPEPAPAAEPDPTTKLSS